MYYHPVSESMDLSVFLVQCTETIYALWYTHMPQCMDHVAVEEWANWSMMMPTVLSVTFGLPVPPHGKTDVTHGPHLMLLMTSPEVDVIL